tara:strand:+ start:682 stop:1353 length:672 start_codon:yes stop_codon:yes gene_type:complete
MKNQEALITLNNICINIWTNAIKNRLREIIKYDEEEYEVNVGVWGDELDEIEDYMSEDYEINITDIRFYDDLPEELQVDISYYEDLDYFVKNLTFGDSFYMNSMVNNYSGEIGFDIMIRDTNAEELIAKYCFVFIKSWIWGDLKNWVNIEVCYYEEYEDEFKKWKNIFKNYITRYNKYLKRTPIRNLMVKYVKKITKKKTACLMLDKLKIIDADIKSEILKNF